MRPFMRSALGGVVGVLAAVASIAPLAAQTAVATPRTLGLRDALAIALVNSPTLRGSADQVELAGIQAQATAAQFDVKFAPVLTTGTDALGAGYRNLGIDVSRRFSTGTRVAFDATSVMYGGAAGAFRDAGYSVTVAQPLLRGVGPAAAADLYAARRTVARSERTHAETRQALALSIAQAYCAGLLEQRLVAAAGLTLDRARRLKAASEARANVGMATQLDVLRADLLAAQAEATLGAEEETLESHIDRLKRLIGEPVDAAIEILGTDLEAIERRLDGDLTPAAGVEDTLVTRARANRLDVREAKDRVADARHEARVAQWNLLPQVDFNASYVNRGLAVGPGEMFSRLLDGWRFGVTAAYPIDRAAKLAASRAANISVQAADRARSETEQSVAAEIRRGYRSWLRTGRTIAIQQRALELAEKQLRLAELRYERGLAGNFDVVDAEANVYQAQSALISARIDRVLAGLTVRRALGALRLEDLVP
jgi:outer membrane protein